MKSAARITIRAIRRRTLKITLLRLSSIAIDPPSQTLLSPIDVGLNPISRCSEIPQHNPQRRGVLVSPNKT